MALQLTPRHSSAVATMALVWGVAWTTAGVLLGMRADGFATNAFIAMVPMTITTGVYGLVLGLWFGLIVHGVSRLSARTGWLVPLSTICVAATAYALGANAVPNKDLSIAFATLAATCSVVSLFLAFYRRRQPDPGVAAGAASDGILVERAPTLASDASSVLAQAAPRSRTPARSLGGIHAHHQCVRQNICQDRH